MSDAITRRTLLASLAAGSAGLALARPAGVLVDTHVHLFAEDTVRFPYAPTATYTPGSATLADYKKFVAASGINHTIIVHPEPYQDDHTYLEYCIENEPSHGFFKGTCLLDTARGDTPDRLKRLMERHPGRIVAFRIHAMQDKGVAPSNTGPIVNRDLSADYMKRAWAAIGDTGIAIQIHFRPHFAKQIAALLKQYPNQTVILDHLGRPGQGEPGDYPDVLALSKFKNVYMKFSAWPSASTAGYPFDDAKPIVRRAFDAFGADRMIWGGLGANMEAFNRNCEVLDNLFGFANDEDRAKVRGLTAMKLFDL